MGLIAALSLRRPFPGRGVLRAFMLLPYVAPVVAATFVWKVMLDEQSGIINYWGTTFFGWDNTINFLGTKPYALLTVIAFEIWRYFPFAFLFITARLLAVPADIEEAATVDGATVWQKFRFVILPQLMPTIALLSVLRMIMTFNKFDDVYLLTGGTAGTEVAAVRVIDTLNYLVRHRRRGGRGAGAGGHSRRVPVHLRQVRQQAGGGGIVMDNATIQRNTFGVLRWVAIVIFAAVTIFPFYYMVLLSLVPISRTAAGSGPAVGPAGRDLARFLPGGPHPGVRGRSGIPAFMLNSAIVAFATVVLTLAGLGARRLRGRPAAGSAGASTSARCSWRCTCSPR